MAFNILADTDQTVARAKHDPNDVTALASDVNLTIPACAGQLGQTFGIDTIRLVQSRRQSLFRHTGINTNDRRPKLRQLAVQPGRQLPSLMHHSPDVATVAGDEVDDR